jgi:hypothetical protein
MAQLSGAMGYPGPTSEVSIASSSQPPKIAFGTTAKDISGNEYVYVDFQTAFAIGELVYINPNGWTADEIAATTRGALGLVVSTVASSDLAGWVQIKGYNAYMLCTSGLTTALAAMAAATTDGFSIPIVGTSDEAARIVGLSITDNPSSATSPEASSILCIAGCTLNYPCVQPIFSS